jgi:heme exporter protein D
MTWTSFDQFLHMGGYGLYVWGSYGVTLAAMLAEALMARQRLRAAQRSAADDPEARI